MDESDGIRRAGQAAYIVVAADVVAIVTISLFFGVGQPFGTLNDAALLVMTVALVPVAAAFHDLGSRLPAGIEKTTLAVGVAAMLAWSVIQAAMIGGLVTFDYERAATGALGAESIALAVIGAWLMAANATAGPWLAARPRWLGIISGLGFIGTAAGILLGGVNHPLAWVGGVGYQLVFPVWAFMVGRTLAKLRAPSPERALARGSVAR